MGKNGIRNLHVSLTLSGFEAITANLFLKNVILYNGSRIMQTAKQEVMELLKDLPDDSTLEEIQYHLYVRQKVQIGIKDVEQGNIFSQAEVEKRMEKWLVK